MKSANKTYTVSPAFGLKMIEQTKGAFFSVVGPNEEKMTCRVPKGEAMQNGAITVLVMSGEKGKKNLSLNGCKSMKIAGTSYNIFN